MLEMLTTKCKQEYVSPLSLRNDIVENQAFVCTYYNEITYYNKI